MRLLVNESPMNKDDDELGTPRDEDMDIRLQTSNELDLNVEQDSHSPKVIHATLSTLSSKEDASIDGILKIGTEFESDEHAYRFYNRYARLLGFNVRKDWANRSKIHGQVVSRKFTCSREGYRRKDKRDMNVKKHQKETRTEIKLMAIEKEESTQVSRRTRRSSASTASNGVKSVKPNDSHTHTLDDLVFGQELISLDDILSCFPGRRVQLLELLRLLGTINFSMPPLFIYGSASTGKTSIILQVFRHLSRPFVYTSCLSCYSPRILFESILNQLLLHKKNAVNGYSSAKRCEKPSDFVNFLHEALANVINSLKENSGKTSASKLKGQVNGKLIYLIFDNFELVREWDRSSSILPFLFGICDILKMPEVGVIFISNTSPDTYHSNTGYVEPIRVYFPEYTEDDLRQIFMRNQANQKLYSSFLDIVLRPFCRITKRVDELSTAFSMLYKKYCEPSSDLGVVPSGEMKRRLFSHLQPHIAPSLNEIFRVASQPSLECEVNPETRRKRSTRKSEGSGDFSDIDFHMSTSAKYLVISAFLVSRNPATLDASLFDSTGGSDSRKRKRKASEKSLEKKEATEQELLMKGPGTFSLERLLAIFQCITSVEDPLGEEEEGNDGLRFDGGSNALMSDVLLQLTSLCNSNFIVKGGSCPLEGSTRYRSTLSEDLALKVARSVKFPLSKYLYRR